MQPAVRRAVPDGTDPNRSRTSTNLSPCVGNTATTPQKHPPTLPRVTSSASAPLIAPAEGAPTVPDKRMNVGQVPRPRGGLVAVSGHLMTLTVTRHSLSADTYSRAVLMRMNGDRLSPSSPISQG